MATCHKADLVFELDGSVHEGNEQKESDAKRDVILSKMALRVVRFGNEEVVKDTSAIFEIIREMVLPML
jgi:very-short-patch-repair endonuclease